PATWLAAPAFRRARFVRVVDRDIDWRISAINRAVPIAWPSRVSISSGLQLARSGRANHSWNDGAGNHRRQRGASERGRKQHLRLRIGRWADCVAEHRFSPHAITARNFRCGGSDGYFAVGFAQCRRWQHERVSFCARPFHPACPVADDSCGHRSHYLGGTDHSLDLRSWTIHSLRDYANRGCSALLRHRPRRIFCGQSARARVLRSQPTLCADVRDPDLNRDKLFSQLVLYLLSPLGTSRSRLLYEHGRCPALFFLFV